MTEYPEIDAAFASARKKMEAAVKEEISSRMSAFLWQLTCRSDGDAIVRAWNEDGDELSCPILEIAKSCAQGVKTAHIDDGFVFDEAEKVAYAMRLSAAMIEDALSDSHRPT